MVEIIRPSRFLRNENNIRQATVSPERLPVRTITVATTANQEALLLTVSPALLIVEVRQHVQVVQAIRVLINPILLIVKVQAVAAGLQEAQAIVHLHQAGAVVAIHPVEVPAAEAVIRVEQAQVAAEAVIQEAQVVQGVHHPAEVDVAKQKNLGLT